MFFFLDSKDILPALCLSSLQDVTKLPQLFPGALSRVLIPVVIDRVSPTTLGLLRLS